MASKFMANTAFKARLPLRSSHQHTVLFGTVNKLECPISGRPMLPPILIPRSYSNSTFPKSSWSTKGSQSSGPENKNWFHSKGWVRNGVVMATVSLALITYATQGIWKDWYQRCVHEPAHESAIYDKLKKGPVLLRRTIEHIIPRKPLIDKIRRLITPSEYGGLYTLIIGKPGTGKTSLIKLAVDDMDEPKGIVYVDMPIWCESEASVATAMQKALGWIPDQSIDSSEPASLKETFEVLSRLAIKYKQEYKKVPVLIIDNADKLVQQNQRLLNQFQDYAADAADKEIIEVVFISSEDGIIPRMVERRDSWPRCRGIIEIGDVSKEEALQYLKSRKIDEEQAAQIYELVGGRMLRLEAIAGEIKSKGTFEVLRQTMFACAEQHLISSGIFPGHPYLKEGAAIIRELLKKGSIPRSTFYGLVGADIGVYSSLRLRRAHFFPCKNKRGGRGKVSEGRGGMRGGEEPSMEELKNWMYEKIETNVAGSVLESTSPELSQIDTDIFTELNQFDDAVSYNHETSPRG